MKKFAITVLLLSSTTVFPMHNAFFRGVQTGCAGYCILSGVIPNCLAYKDLKSRERDLSQGLIPEVSPVVKEWSKKELKELIPMEVPVVIGPEWQTDGISIEMPLNDMHNLEIALQNVEQNENFINQKKHSLGHEVGHVLYKHHEKIISAGAIIPCIIQSACSGTSYLFNKFFNIQSPQTWKKALTRSCLAAGSTPLKLGLCFIGTQLYSRRCEKEAENFACKNATTKAELTNSFTHYQESDANLKQWLLQDNHEKFYSKFTRQNEWYTARKAIFDACAYMYKPIHSPLLKTALVETASFAWDPVHSSSAYYANMTQKHINEWDENH